MLAAWHSLFCSNVGFPHRTCGTYRSNIWLQIVIKKEQILSHHCVFKLNWQQKHSKLARGLPNQCFVRLATSHQQPEGHFHNSGTLEASGMSLLHSALQSLQYVRCGLECQKCVIAHNAQITNSQRLRLFFGVYELLFTVI